VTQEAKASSSTAGQNLIVPDHWLMTVNVMFECSLAPGRGFWGWTNPSSCSTTHKVQLWEKRRLQLPFNGQTATTHQQWPHGKPGLRSTPRGKVVEMSAGSESSAWNFRKNKLKQSQITETRMN
jgi:hypothetical protein